MSSKSELNINLVKNPPKKISWALFDGTNYDRKKGRLEGCVIDVNNWFKYLNANFGPLTPENTHFLVDDVQQLLPEIRNGGYSIRSPVKQNLIAEFKWMASNLKTGEWGHIHYSGHGGQEKDLNGDEDDRKDEALIPLDYQENGVLVDDDIRKILFNMIPEGSLLTNTWDCCHSGTIGDLPQVARLADSSGGPSSVPVSTPTPVKINPTPAYNPPKPIQNSSLYQTQPHQQQQYKPSSNYYYPPPPSSQNIFAQLYSNYFSPQYNVGIPQKPSYSASSPSGRSHHNKHEHHHHRHHHSRDTQRNDSNHRHHRRHRTKKNKSFSAARSRSRSSSSSSSSSFLTSTRRPTYQRNVQLYNPHQPQRNIVYLNGPDVSKINRGEIMVMNGNTARVIPRSIILPQNRAVVPSSTPFMLGYPQVRSATRGTTFRSRDDGSLAPVSTKFRHGHPVDQDMFTQELCDGRSMTPINHPDGTSSSFEYVLYVHDKVDYDNEDEARARLHASVRKDVWIQPIEEILPEDRPSYLKEKHLPILVECKNPTNRYQGSECERKLYKSSEVRMITLSSSDANDDDGEEEEYQDEARGTRSRKIGRRNARLFAAPLSLSTQRVVELGGASISSRQETKKNEKTFVTQYLSYASGNSSSCSLSDIGRGAPTDLKMYNYPETKGVVILFSGCMDTQTSADAYIQNQSKGAMSHFSLAALNNPGCKTWRDVLYQTRAGLKNDPQRYDQIPQISFGTLGDQLLDSPCPLAISCSLHKM